MGAPVPSTTETFDAFFSDFYLRAYANDERQDEAEHQAIDAVRLAHTPEGGDVLDVPCGFGRHSIPLARAGYRVTGVDRSSALLAEARRRAGDDGPGPELVAADYQRLPLADETFDTAVNLFSSLGYLGDEGDTRVLAELHRVLRPGGRLVVETMHRDRLARAFDEADWRAVGGGRLLLEQRGFDVASGIAQVTQTLIDAEGGRESRTWSIRVYAATELLGMMRAAGFAEARCLGGFDGTALTLDTRLVIVARR